MGYNFVVIDLGDRPSIRIAISLIRAFYVRIWVAGLEGLCRERAAALISRGGGVRYDCPHERVTHAVCGNVAAAVAAVRALPSVLVLNATWLVKSVQAGKALDEAQIEVQGLDEEAICELGAEVAAAGGVLSAAGAGGTHTLVPLDFDPGELITASAEPVTVFWVKDCLSQQELLPIEYYHRPVKVPQWEGNGPLQGVVASLSTYSGIERAFLDELAKLLGATTQLRFCRRNTANALASTHLICPTPTGDKYLGAVKWGLPAVKASWLMECVRQGARVSEKEHLVGDTKAPPIPEKITEEPPDPNLAKDKENNEMLPPQVTDVPRRQSVPSRDGTPKNKNLDSEDMSPASRYIAMARQGLLGCDSQETPKRLQHLKDDARQEGEAVRTPPLEDALSTPNLIGLSPTTRRRLQAIRRGEMPSDPVKTPTDPFERNPETPDSGFGAALRPGTGRLSPDARKRLWKVVNDLPTKEQTPKEKHTPLSEIRNRFLAQFNGESPLPTSDHNLAPRKLQLQVGFNLKHMPLLFLLAIIV
ncbi:hypothetical protein evm_014740 [Chilo suppressalis]|nr:hypothetical protein evm_014740 [Chilo suppressalis]